jgi:hypothetical protein
MEEEHEDFPNNRFDAVLQQPPQQRHNVCKPPTRRASAECCILPSDASAATCSLDLTSAAYQSFDHDSAILTVETDLLEQDSNPNQGCLVPFTRTNCGDVNILPTQTFRRLTPTLEVPEEQEHQSDWDEEMLDEEITPSSTPMPVETTTAAPKRGRRTRNNKPHTTPRQNFSRDSITLESAVINQTFGNNSHWGVKSSISLDSALFDESAIDLVKPDDDDECPSSKRTSWAVGSSLTLATFEEDSLSVIKSAGCHQDHDKAQDQSLHHHDENFITTVEKNRELTFQEMNRLRFSSQGDSLSIDNAGNELCRPIPSTFSSITPCTKPIRTQSIPTDVDKNDAAEEAS